MEVPTTDRSTPPVLALLLAFALTIALAGPAAHARQVDNGVATDGRSETAALASETASVILSERSEKQGLEDEPGRAIESRARAAGWRTRLLTPEGPISLAPFVSDLRQRSHGADISEDASRPLFGWQTGLRSHLRLGRVQV